MNKPTRKEFCLQMMLHYLHRLDQEYDSCSERQFSFLVNQFEKYEWEYIGYQVADMIHEINQFNNAQPAITGQDA